MISSVLFMLAAAALPVSGEYGQLKLAFSGGRVTGAFSAQRMGNGTQAASQFSCGFALTGVWPGGEAAEVLTWWPGEDPADQRIRGRLTVRGGTAALKLAENPGGCAMTGEDFSRDGYTETLTARRAWIEVREVKSARARLRATPTAAPGRAYLTRGDTVGVLAWAGAAVRVEYVDGRRATRGWLPLADLQPAQPPPMPRTP